MRIAGLQKVSTIDYPGEICCVVFLHGCNFRCGFCYNPELVIGNNKGLPKAEGRRPMSEPLVHDLTGKEAATGGRPSVSTGFSQSYVLDFLSRRMGKLDGVCITGGEPLMTLSKDFVRRVKAMGFKVKIDTNGSFPDRLREFIEEGLVDYVAMDVKSCREDYCEVAGVDVDLGKIEKSIRIVNELNSPKSKVQSPKVRSEFRTTVVSGLHDSEKLKKMGVWMGEVCGGKPGRIFLQGFKRGEEMIDSSFAEKSEVLEGELLKMKGCVEGLFGEVGVRV